MIHAADSVISRHWVRDEIQNAILRGEFPPGARLKQMDLARRFGVAQSVVRESLLELRFYGLVETVDNLGVFVGDLGLHRLLEAYEVREVFEGLAARRCCQRVSRGLITELEAMAQEILELSRARKLDAMIALDRRFHQTIVATAGNSIVSRLTEAYRALGMAVWAHRDGAAVRDEHLAIVRAISDNRPDHAEKLARAHVAAARAAIEKQAAGGGFNPRWVLEPAGAPARKSRRIAKTRTSK